MLSVQDVLRDILPEWSARSSALLNYPHPESANARIPVHMTCMTECALHTGHIKDLRELLEG